MSKHAWSVFFFTMHKWVTHLHICTPYSPSTNAYQSVFISAVWHKCSPHCLQAHAVRGVYICSSIHHSWPQGATYYSESTAVIKSQTSANKNQRHSCKSLKVVALKGRGLGDSCSAAVGHMHLKAQNTIRGARGHHPVWIEQTHFCQTCLWGRHAWSW